MCQRAVGLLQKKLGGRCATIFVSGHMTPCGDAAAATRIASRFSARGPHRAGQMQQDKHPIRISRSSAPAHAAMLTHGDDF
jgi:hypothetical protein